MTYTDALHTETLTLLTSFVLLVFSKQSFFVILSPLIQRFKEVSQAD